MPAIYRQGVTQHCLHRQSHTRSRPWPLLPPAWRHALLWLLSIAVVPERLSADTLALSAELSQALHNSPVILIRHALAPGTGDPQDFRLGDCSTQRNLSSGGRKQAQEIGRLLKTLAIQPAWVHSSQWCRCLETAQLMTLAPVKQQPLLNSFFREGDPGRQQTRALAEWIHQQPENQPLVLITHQVNITALTSVFPGSGELVVLQRQAEELKLIGTLETR